MRRPGAAELSYLDSETFDAWSQARKMWCCSSRSRPTFTLPQSSYPLFGDREKKKTQDKASTILVALFLKVNNTSINQHMDPCMCCVCVCDVQYNNGFLLDIILWTCYYPRGVRLNAMKRPWHDSLCSHLNDLFSLPCLGDTHKV